ncbi:hypothetical protein ILYODFUR_019906 [Ilyodon furcidens]|uniref:Uncharacterized protein n=1 Tax=Ilyodon furcidens TaxID=33524 RepID=A0ABV0UAP2_9TELE
MFGSTNSSFSSSSHFLSSPHPFTSFFIFFICSFSSGLLIVFEPARQSKGEKTRMRTEKEGLGVQRRCSLGFQYESEREKGRWEDEDTEREPTAGPDKQEF